MIWRGVAVGVLISAPMGPVGILCIQRTLDKGRHAGFYTGVGAAISDLFYCLLTGFGLSFIEDFIERNQNVIQLVGSVVLVAFSIYLFRKDPSSPLRRPVPQEVSARKNILGGFLFTFSNPLIIFLIIGLFARFNFTSPDIKGPYYAIGYLFIVAGALGWWYGITYAIEKVRSRFNMRAMKIMNIVIGIVILIFACVGMATSISGLTSKANAAPADMTYIKPSSGALTDTLRSSADISLDLPDVSEFQLDFKLRPLGMKGALRSSDVGLFTISLIPSVDSSSETLALNVYATEHSPTPLSSQSALRCDASSTGGFLLSSGTPLAKGVNPPAGWCHYRLKLTPADGLRLYAGEARLEQLLALPATVPSPLSGLQLSPAPVDDRCVEIRDVRLSIPRLRPEPCKALTAAFAEAKGSDDPIVGLWEMFDWSFDTKKARQGGEYRLLTALAPDGHYDLLYVDGAETLSGHWQPGMVKGRLYPTGTPYIYRLEWIDAEGETLSTRLRAQADPEKGLLTLLFPLLDSEIRLMKISLPEKLDPQD